MTKPKIKKITSKEEAELNDDDMCVYYLQFDENMTQIMLTISAQRSISPEEYMLALQSFVNDCSEFPENLFVEDAVGSNEDRGLH